jgi:Flp pilus assembly protein TadD
MESSVRLDEQTLKLYVTGCAQVADVGARDLQSVIAVFRQVIDMAPRFKSAWAKLLLAESKATLAERDAPLPERQAALAAGKVETRSKLRQDIVRARELQPDMTEALLAESAMLPSNAYGETLRLLDRAKQSSPENASVLEFRAAALMKVGRWSDAIADSKRAAELSPLSPSAISSYALTLAYAGRIDAARTELERAERLWPRTQALRELQYSFHWHFGDPMLALKLTPPGLPKGREMYLRARAEPSEAKIDQFLSFIRALYSRQERTDVGRGVLQQFAALHREDELYEWLLGPRGQGLSASSEVLFRPALKTFRQDPRFMILAKRAGLLDYWRRSGKWPDFCSEEELPYDCKTEAAKIAPLR